MSFSGAAGWAGDRRWGIVLFCGSDACILFVFYCTYLTNIIIYITMTHYQMILLNYVLSGKADRRQFVCKLWIDS